MNPVKTSDKHSSNSVNVFAYVSSSIFTDGGRKMYVRFNFSHTYLIITTDKPVTLYAVLPSFCVKLSVIITVGSIPMVHTLMGQPIKSFGTFAGYKLALCENLLLLSKTHSPAE